ncbi:MAG: radical SAM protein [Thaumarchaeota archaeon]|jgi:DNA repair photolyase|nr:radical SAM protein [Candidatus Wolframiiraptor allenii]
MKILSALGVRTRIIKPFDPWRGKLCTCPSKFSFDPYTGCEHGCLYCYASSYVRRFHECRPKRDLLRVVRNDVARLPDDVLISMSNSSDPYPPMERDMQLTRRCLEEFRRRNLRILVITKSDLVLRDLDLLRRLRCAVTLTITTLDDDLARRLEPGAPPPSRRLDAAERLSSEGIMVGVRVDPIIPYLNDEGLMDLLREIRGAGAIHVTSSTFKPRPDSWARIEMAFPDTAEKLRPLYFEEGERIGRSRYLPRPMRFRLMKMIADGCRGLGLTFACCREGFVELNTGASCDGSHLIPAKPYSSEDRE